MVVDEFEPAETTVRDMTPGVSQESLVRPLELIFVNILTTLQRALWKPLTVPPSFFDDCNKHPVNYILPENYERRLYCFDCENIEFQDEQGERIWSTQGEGEMDCLPPKVGVYIVRGKSSISRVV